MTDNDFEATTGRDGASATALDELFDALAHPHRRIVLRTLEQRAEPASLPELVRRVGARERNVEVTDVDRDCRRVIRAELVHVHLPKLADCGLIELDGDAIEPAGDLAPICNVVSVASRYAVD